MADTHQHTAKQPQMPQPGNGSQEVADALNALLADSFALYVKTKNFHWHVCGPHFHDYHLLFDAQSAGIFAITDAIAERVRKIGHNTLRSIGDIARHQRIEDSETEGLEARDMLKELRDDNLQLIEQLRALKRLADDTGDNATSSVVDDWTDQAETRAWFLLEASA